MIVASGSGSRKRGTLVSARRKILEGLGIETLDIFFAEYINPSDDFDAIFGEKGVLDELIRWKAEGTIRYVGATAHDRTLARRLAADPRVDVLMHRYNMAHRKSADDVFPAAQSAKTPVVAFTATRWRSLLESHAGWSGPPPSAVDCYRYCRRTRRCRSFSLHRKRSTSWRRILPCWRRLRSRMPSEHGVSGLGIPFTDAAKTDFETEWE